MNEHVNKLKNGTNILLVQCANVIEFTQSHRSEDVIYDSYDKFAPGLKLGSHLS